MTYSKNKTLAWLSPRHSQVNGGVSTILQISKQVSLEIKHIMTVRNANAMPIK